MVTVPPPVFVNVTVCVTLLATLILPKLMLAGLAPRLPDGTAVPERAMLVGALLALLVMLTLPVAAPLTVGAKVKVSVAL